MNNTPADQSKLESPIAFAVLASSVIGLGVVLWWRIVVAYPKLEDRAAFGSLFGGINALFAALAFAALAFTLVLQQRALAMQRMQILEQQHELAAQSRRLEAQAFEGMLFRLIGFHHDIAKDIQVFPLGAQRELRGRQALRRLADDLRGTIANESRDQPTHSSITVAQLGYEKFHQSSRGILDHYFRNLYHIIKFIESAKIIDKRTYTSLVRAQLSPAELILLFYNCVSPYGEKFKPLIETYALLEQLPPSELNLPGHKSLYSPGAYDSAHSGASG